MTVPDRLRDKLRVGNWVLIQPTVERSTHLPEILEVMDTPRKRFYGPNDLKPDQFEGSDVLDQM